MADLGIRPDGDGYVVEKITWTRIASFVERSEAELFVRARLGGPADKPIRPTVVADVTPTKLSMLPLPPSVPELMQADQTSTESTAEPDPDLPGEPVADLVATPPLVRLP